VDYDEMAKEELQEELDRRDLPRSGNKAELIERLEEAEANGDQRKGGAAADIGTVLAQAKQSFGQLTNLAPEAVSHVERVDDGWEATFEVLELERVPRSTDVLASYEVELDSDGNLKAWRRVRRYSRNQQEET